MHIEASQDFLLLRLVIDHIEQVTYSLQCVLFDSLLLIFAFITLPDRFIRFSIALLRIPSAGLDAEGGTASKLRLSLSEFTV